MNNIIECTSGACEHTAHNLNGVLWLIAVAILIVGTKYYYDHKDCNEK